MENTKWFICKSCEATLKTFYSVSKTISNCLYTLDTDPGEDPYIIYQHDEDIGHIGYVCPECDSELDEETVKMIDERRGM